MNRNGTSWGLVLKPTEAGRWLAPHIPDIEKILNGAGKLHFNGSGPCQVQLPDEFDERQADAVARELNGLVDDKGRAILEVEITPKSPAVLRDHPARSFP